MKRQRQKFGSVVLDKRINTWNFIWWEDGKRRSKVIGSRRDFPTKTSAWKVATSCVPPRKNQVQPNPTLTVAELVNLYRVEKMPQRFSTSRGYDAWFTNHIVPKWGNCQITELQARPVERWLLALVLAPKSKVHIRGLIRALWEYAMWRADVPTQRNPMELVTIKGATKRVQKPRSLTVEEFRAFVSQLEEPCRTIALVCVCFGLRISECLALKWSDVDWLNGQLRVERAIVRQRVGDVKTIYSGRQMSISPEMLEVLKSWRQASQFSADDDWVFASPVKIGRLPVSYPWVWQMFQKASAQAGIGRFGTHSMRHTYRSWLDAVGTPIAVQQKLMRHSDIRTTINIYGDVVTNEMSQASAKVAALALNGL
jgi:integrase